MPLDRLQKQIIEDAWRKADALRGDAQKQAESIVRHARAAAEDAGKGMDKELKQEFSRAEEEQRENAELQERGLMLDARSRLVESLMPRLKAMTVKRIKKEGYGRLINRAIEEAGKIAPQEELTLLIGRNDAKLVKSFGGRVKYGKVSNGVELRNKNGNVRVAATIEDMFDKSRPDIEALLVSDAFPHRGPKRTDSVRVRRAGKRRRG